MACQTVSRSVCSSRPQTSVNVASTTKEPEPAPPAPSETIAPLNPTAEAAKKLPASRPIRTGCQLAPPSRPAPRGRDMTKTPAVAVTMATTASGLSLSDRKIRPKTATCTASVFT
jgi:hypothetical protein